jgi:hypothetical protein
MRRAIVVLVLTLLMAHPSLRAWCALHCQPDATAILRVSPTALEPASPSNASSCHNDAKTESRDREWRPTPSGPAACTLPAAEPAEVQLVSSAARAQSVDASPLFAAFVPSLHATASAASFLHSSNQSSPPIARSLAHVVLRI